MSWNVLKAAIDSAVYTNGVGAITGSSLNTILKSIVDNVGGNMSLVGVAQPNTLPVSSPDGKVFYLASQNGTYVNFGGATITDELAMLSWNGSSWVKTKICDLAVSETSHIAEIDIDTMLRLLKPVAGQTYNALPYSYFDDIGLTSDVLSKMGDGTITHIKDATYQVGFIYPIQVVRVVDGYLDLLKFGISTGSGTDPLEFMFVIEMGNFDHADDYVYVNYREV